VGIHTIRRVNSMKEHDGNNPVSRCAYEAPKATFVKLEPEERLLVCLKGGGECDLGFQAQS